MLNRIGNIFQLNHANVTELPLITESGMNYTDKTIKEMDESAISPLQQQNNCCRNNILINQYKHQISTLKQQHHEKIKALNEEIIKLKNEKIKIMSDNINYLKILHSMKQEQDDEDSNNEDNNVGVDNHELLDELLDDELCEKLQNDLENYMVDQKKRKKYPLEELKIFHENRAQIIRNWDNLLYRNYVKNLWETLTDKLEEQLDGEYNIDTEKKVYNILFDIVVECYDILHTEYSKIQQNDYMSPRVIDMVLMNMNNFYDLMQRNKLKGRIVNIYEYINNKIEEIYKIIQQNHTNYIDDDSKDEICKFIVNCCEIIWSALHYDFKIYPLHFLENGYQIKYDEQIHENDGNYHGENIKHYVFPALRKKNNKYVTKMWVICGKNQ